MTTTSVILDTDIGDQDTLRVHVDRLRHGDIEPRSGSMQIGSATFVEPQVEFMADYDNELVMVQNLTGTDWPVGSEVIIHWDGYALEDGVHALEDRVTALEAGGGGGASTGNTFDDPVYFKGDSSSDYGIYIDSPDKDYGAGILASLGGVRRWEIMLGDGSPETMGTNQGNNFEIGRYSDFNQYMDAPLVIDRKSGCVVIKIPECADSAAAGAAGVPIGGLYHTSGNVKVRLY